MKIDRPGVLPQMELGPRLGGAKVLFQRSGIIMRSVTMVSAMLSAWSTTPMLRMVFQGAFSLFILAVIVALAAWMAFDYVVLLPSQQTFNQEQAHRTERSPLKRDTEEILERLDDKNRARRVADDNQGAGR